MFLLCVMLHRFHQQFVVYVVEKAFDVQINYPTVFHTIDTALLYGFVCRFVRTITVAVWMKMLVNNCLQFSSNNLLGYSVHYRGYAQWTHFTVSFRNQYLSYWFRKIAPTRHPVPQRIQILAWVLSYLLNAYSVNT